MPAALDEIKIVEGKYITRGKIQKIKMTSKSEKDIQWYFVQQNGDLR
jgi:hypothetical protein